MNLEKAQKHIRNAWITGVVDGTLLMIFSLLTLVGITILDHVLQDWPFAIVIYGLTLGIYKRNRVCTVLLFLLSVTYIFSVISSGTIIQEMPVAVALIYFYFQGVRGTFAYHRLTKKENEISKDIKADKDTENSIVGNAGGFENKEKNISEDILTRKEGKCGSIYLKFIQIISSLFVILISLFCIPAFFLLLMHLGDDSPEKLSEFFYLSIPLLILPIFLKIRSYFKKKNTLTKFSKIDYLISIISIISFIIVIRGVFILPGISTGGLQTNLPIKNYWATASGGQSVRFFGGVKKDMSLSILKGYKTLWNFDTEVYPHTFNWREGSITFDDKTNTVTFKQDSPNGKFTTFILVTPNIIDKSENIFFSNKSEKSIESPNGKFIASVQSDKDKMEFVVKDSKQNILWKCEMKNCSTVIDWKNGRIAWGHMGDVIFDYSPSGNTHFKKFYLNTGPIGAYPYMVW